MNEVARQRKSLGRGLSALLSDDDVPAASPSAAAAPSGGLLQVSIAKLEANPDQPRKAFDDEELDALAASVKEKGLLQPILVRSNPRKAGEYEIVAGERRWRAAQRAQLHEVPVVIKEMDDAVALEVAIIENVQRVDLNPLEEAQGYQRLIDAFDYTQEALAQVVSKSRSHIANMLRLLKLPESIRDYLREGALTVGHARALIAYYDAEALADEAVRKNLSVREVENRIRNDAATLGNQLANAEKSRKQPRADADTEALQADLSAALGAKVKIEHKGKGGRLVIKYKSLDQLDELCEKLGL